jgi:hypothetical protein
LRRLLTTMARRKVADKRRRVAHQPEPLPAGWDATAAVPAPIQALLEGELVQAILDRLSPRERWLAEQRSLGRSWVDVGREAEADPDLLRIQYARAIARVRTELKES